MSRKVCHRLSFLCGFTASFIAALVSGFVFKFPFSFLEPVFCIQVVGINCPPFTINWINFYLDFLFWICVIFLAQIFSILVSRVVGCPKSKSKNKQYQNMPFWIGMGIVIAAVLLIFSLMGDREFQKPDFHSQDPQDPEEQNMLIKPTTTPTPRLILKDQQSAPKQCTSCGCGK